MAWGGDNKSWKGVGTCIIFMLFLLASLTSNAAIIKSVKSGNWSDPTTWAGGKIPGGTVKDDAIITTGTTVTVNVKINTTVGKKFMFPIGSIIVEADAVLQGDGTGSSNLNFGTDQGEDLVNWGTINFAGINRLHFTITKSSRWGGNGKFSLNDLEVDNGARLTFTQVGDQGTPANFTINIAGNFQIHNGSITAIPLVSFNFNGLKAQTLTTQASFYNMYFNNPEGVYLAESLTANNLKGNIYIQSGVLYTGAYNLDGNATNSITVSDGAELNIGTTTNEYNGFPANFKEVTLAPNSTVNYSAAAQQSIFPKTYGNLTISGSRAGASVIFPNLSQYPTFDVSIKVMGKFSPIATFTTGSYKTTGSRIHFTGTNAQTIPAFNYNDLQFSGDRGSNNITLSPTGTITISGKFLPEATFAEGDYISNGSTINFNGTDAQTIPAFAYHNLISSSTGNRILATDGIIKIAGAFTPGTNNYPVTNNTIELNGTSTQALTYFNYQNLIISGTDKTITSGNPIIHKSLSFTSGKINTGNNKLILSQNAFVQNASSTSYVVGNLEKYFSTGSAISQTYEIGTTAGYTPVRITFPLVSIAGSLTLNSVNTEHSRITESCLDEQKSLNMFWKVAPTIIQPLLYNATFTYLPVALDPGITTEKLLTGFYNTSWSYGAAVVNNNKISVSNINTVGDIIFAQRALPIVITNPINAAVVVENNTSFLVTATGKYLAYQWQVNKGTGWNNITADGIYSGITAPQLTISKAPASLDSYQYRLILSGSCGPTDTSAVAKLEVNTYPVITAQPASISSCPGNTTFEVSATGNLLQYNWQVSTNGGSTWSTLSENSTYPTINSATLTITGATYAMNNYRYRCEVVGRGNLKVLSKDATLTIFEPLAIKIQPVNNTTCETANSGFSITAGGIGLTYQWQTNEGMGWENLFDNDTYKGSKTAILSIEKAPISLSEVEYRCLVKGTCAPFEVTSTPAMLKVNPVGTWVGISGDWGNSNNWCGGTPDASTDIRISSTSVLPQISNNATCRDLIIDQGASVVIATGSLTVNGNLDLHGTLSVGGNKLTFNGSNISGTATNLLTTTNSSLEFGGNGSNLILPANATALRNLVLNNPNGLQLSTNLSLNGILTLTKGKLTLNTNNLTIASTGSISGADSTKYIVTPNNPVAGGYLIQRVSSASSAGVNFPVGTPTSYSPASVILASGSTADFFRVRAFDGVLTKGTFGENGTNGIVSDYLAVKRTWLIEETTSGGSIATIRLNWSAKDEGDNFRRNSSAVAHYSNNKWDWGTLWTPAVYDKGYYAQTRTGLTSFSPFTVVDNAIAQITTVNAKILLDGVYDKTSGKMNTYLNEYKFIPLKQPYTIAPWNYAGGETVTSTFFNQHPEIVDWVLLEIRTGTGLNARVVRKACFLKDNGTLLDIDGTSIPTFNGVASGNYYIIVRHRNHLTTMSATPVSITSNSPLYDFTIGKNKFYGGFAKNFGNNIFGTFGGDANNDGEIDSIDANIYWKANNGKTGYHTTDFNLDGETDAMDSNIIWAPNNGMLSPVE